MSSTGTVFNLSETYTSAGPCPTCGVTIVMPQHLYNTRRNDHERFFCPNGHAASFGQESELEKKLKEAEKSLANQRARLEWAEADAKRAKEARDHAQRQASAARGQVTKIKNRVGNGVCPCCNRTFTNLQRHMGTKHPEFKNEASE
jgi:predicted RNA-binding Zn-ribbon protein involved in translation (DUF1610 family)